MLKPATLLKVTLFHECFSYFFNSTDGTKPWKASHIVLPAADDLQIYAHVSSGRSTRTTHNLIQTDKEIAKLQSWKEEKRDKILKRKLSCLFLLINLKLASAIFDQIFIFHQMIAL